MASWSWWYVIPIALSASVAWLPQLFSPESPQAAPVYEDFGHWANLDGWRHLPLLEFPFTPVLSCEPNTSVLMSRFDWKIVPVSGWTNVYSPGLNLSGKPHASCSALDNLPWVEDTEVTNPKSVWAAPHAVERLLQLAEARLKDSKRWRRTVVFSGSELPLSYAFGQTEQKRAETVERLKKYFSRILYAAKDIQLEGVGLAPVGLSWGYTMSQLYFCALKQTVQPIEHALTELYNTTHGDLSGKTRGVLATSQGLAGWLEDNKTIEVVKVLAQLKTFLPPSNSSLRAVAAAYESRIRLKAWLGVSESGQKVRSEAALAAGVEYRKFGAAEWLQELSSYKFLLSPLGSGIQVATNVEALLVLTIPVVQHMGFTFVDELIHLGFPLVKVRGWTEVTAANVSRWWQALSPRLQSFRRNCLSVDGYWQLYTGQVTFCS